MGWLRSRGPRRRCADLGSRRAGALEHLGVVQTVTGDYPAAAASLTRALELFRDLGDRHGEAGALINLGEPRHTAKPAITTPKRSASSAPSTHRSSKHGRSKESDDVTARKETPAKAPHTCDKPSPSTSASEPLKPSASKRRSTNLALLTRISCDCLRHFPGVGRERTASSQCRRPGTSGPVLDRRRRGRRPARPALLRPRPEPRPRRRPQRPHPALELRSRRGNVNRLKMLKRQMYGRATFGLLRKRVLLR